MNFKTHTITDIANPINSTFAALHDAQPEDILVIKAPINTFDYDTLKGIYDAINALFPLNHVIFLAKDIDILDYKSREEYKEFLKRELASLEEAEKNG